MRKTYALLAPSGVSNSFQRSLLSILASLLSLKTTKPTDVSVRTSIFSCCCCFFRRANVVGDKPLKNYRGEEILTIFAAEMPRQLWGILSELTAPSLDVRQGTTFVETMICSTRKSPPPQEYLHNTPTIYVYIPVYVIFPSFPSAHSSPSVAYAGRRTAHQVSSTLRTGNS